MCTNTIDVWNGGGEAINMMRKTNKSNKEKKYDAGDNGTRAKTERKR